MKECELCEAKADKKAKIEGAILNVCSKCVNLGEEIKSVMPIVKRKEIKLPEELDLVIVDDFASLIKNAREKKALSQEKLAKAISEKASVIKRIEEGWEPSLKIARKLENFLEIKLIESVPKVSLKKKDETKGLTIGDIIEIED